MLRNIASTNPPKPSVALSARIFIRSNVDIVRYNKLNVKPQKSNAGRTETRARGNEIVNKLKLKTYQTNNNKDHSPEDCDREGGGVTSPSRSTFRWLRWCLAGETDVDELAEAQLMGVCR